MTLSRELASYLCRQNLDDLAARGNPTDAEINAKIAEYNALSEKGKRKFMRKLEGVSDDISDALDAFEDFKERMANSSTNVAFYTLSTNDLAYAGQNTTVAFNTLNNANSTDNALTSLGLTLRNGVFTNTKANNLLNINFQILFDQASGTTGAGIRSACIVVGNRFFGRNESSATNRGVFVSGGAIIRLGRNDTFFIRVFQTDTGNVDILSNNSYLSISNA